MKSRTCQHFLAVVCTIIGIGAFSSNVWADIDNSSVSQETKETDPIMESGILFTATLDSAVAGPVAQSYPPIYTHSLKLTIKEVFRGQLNPGQSLTASHQARQLQVPVFPLNKLCVVAISDVQGRFNVDFIEEASDELVNKAHTAGKMALGWKMVDDKFVSPWEAMGEKFWPKDAEGFSADEPKCSKTGRPVLLVGQGIKFSVEPVPPVEEIQWTNPDGDGLYKITVTNTSNESRLVQALLTDGDKILWNESIVIMCQKKAQPPALCAKQIPKTVMPMMLLPGQSVSGQVNAFGLRGIEWPRGGYRIEFMFCLGEKSVKQSFYYMSRHHDKIREQVESELAND